MTSSFFRWTGFKKNMDISHPIQLILNLGMSIFIVHIFSDIMTEDFLLVVRPFKSRHIFFDAVVGGKLSPVSLVIPLSAVCLQPVKYKQPLAGPFLQIMYIPLPPSVWVWDPFSGLPISYSKPQSNSHLQYSRSTVTLKLQ